MAGKCLGQCLSSPPILLTYKSQETKKGNRNELEEQRKLRFCQGRWQSLLHLCSCPEQQFCMSCAISRRERFSPAPLSSLSWRSLFPRSLPGYRVVKHGWRFQRQRRDGSRVLRSTSGQAVGLAGRGSELGAAECGRDAGPDAQG